MKVSFGPEMDGMALAALSFAGSATGSSSAKAGGCWRAVLLPLAAERRLRYVGEWLCRTIAACVLLTPQHDGRHALRLQR